MKRPEKKVYHENTMPKEAGDRIYGFNRCHDEHTPYIEWLKKKNEEEIIRATEKYAHNVIPKLNDKWRKRIEQLKKRPSVEWLRKFFEEYFGCHDEITKEHHVGSLPQDLHDRLNKE